MPDVKTILREHGVAVAALVVLLIAIGFCAHAPEPVPPNQDQHAAKIAALTADTARLHATIHADSLTLERTRDSLADARERTALAHDSLEAQADEYSAWEDARRALVPRPRVEKQGGSANVTDSAHAANVADSTHPPAVDCATLVRNLNAALKHDDTLFAAQAVYADSLRAVSQRAIDSVRAIDGRLMAEKDAELAEANQHIAALTKPPNAIERAWDVVKYPLLITASFIAGVKAAVAVR